MTKEKEAFDILLQHIETEADWSDYEKVKNAHKTVEEALKRLEALDNAEPSEALKCLEYIKSQSPICYDNDGKFYVFEKEFDTIKQALLQGQKEHRALEIIKNKPQAELSCIQLGEIKTYEEYLEYTSVWELDLYGYMLYEEEEFDLLKEVLECAD